MITTQELSTKVSDWLRFVNEPYPVTEDDLLKLEAILDALAVARHAVGATEQLDTEDGETSPPRSDESDLRKRLSSRFPMLGWYNLPEKVTSDLTATGLLTGDAIDDILDITNELAKVHWLITEGRPGDARWAFGFSFDHHWRYHTRELLWYLEMRRREAL